MSATSSSAAVMCRMDEWEWSEPWTSRLWVLQWYYHPARRCKIHRDVSTVHPVKVIFVLCIANNHQIVPRTPDSCLHYLCLLFVTAASCLESPKTSHGVKFQDSVRTALIKGRNPSTILTSLAPLHRCGFIYLFILWLNTWHEIKQAHKRVWRRLRRVNLDCRGSRPARARVMSQPHKSCPTFLPFCNL